MKKTIKGELNKLPQGLYLVRLDEHAFVYIKEGDTFIFDSNCGTGQLGCTATAEEKIEDVCARQFAELVQVTPSKTLKFYKVEPLPTVLYKPEPKST